MQNRSSTLIGLAALVLSLFAVFRGVDAGECTDALLFSDHRSGEPLFSVPLTTSDRGFVLAYRHSVHLSTVYSGYTIRDGRIVQLWERYEQPGYGMTSRVEGTDQSLGVDGKDLMLRLEREFAEIVLRIQTGARNRLVEPIRDDLSRRFGDRAVLLSVRNDCTQGTMHGNGH